MNVILLHSNHRHVSATHVDIFRVVRTRIQLQLQCVEIIPQLTHYGGRVTQICVFALQLCRTGDADLRF